MELKYEEYLSLHSLNVLITYYTGEEFEGKILGCRNNPEGELKSLLIQESKGGEINPLPLENIKYILHRDLNGA